MVKKYGGFMGEIVNVDGLSDVAIKLIEKISGAVGWIFNKKSSKKEAVNSFIEDIKQNESLDPLNKGILIYNAKKLIKEYSNQSQIISKALEIITPQANPQDVDDDWISLFLEYAKLISDEEFQELWAQILAQECNYQHSISKRTLNLVRHISQTEALVFQKVAPLIVVMPSEGFIVYDDEAMKKHGVTYTDLLMLDDCGIIKARTIGESHTLEKEEKRVIFFNSDIACLVENYNGGIKDYTFNMYRLTQSGFELFNALMFETNNDYVLDVIKDMAKTRNKGFRIMAKKIKEINNETMIFEEKPIFIGEN